MILDDIKKKLEEIDPRVYYGIVDNSVKDTPFDYIVFNRVKPRATANKTGRSYYYDVHIIRENFVEEDLDVEVIAKMCEIDGMRESGEDGSYEYVMKPNTNTVVEILTLHFVRAKKNVYTRRQII